MTPRTWANTAALAVTLVLGSGTARADWLVTRTGERIETAGAWQLKGAVVVFTAPSGTLSSIRLSEVDLEASRAETERAKNPPPPPPPPPAKKSVLVLTDADVKPAKPPEPPPAQGQPAVTATPNTALTVMEWREMDETDALDVQLLGTLNNTAREASGEISLGVKLVDRAGKVLAQTDALLTSDALGPGQTTNFRAVFPGVYAYSSVQFEPVSRLRILVPPAEKEEPKSSGS